MFRVVKEFSFYHDGINPTFYGLGEQDLPEDAAQVAVAEGWAEAIEADPPEDAAPKKRGRK